MTRGQYAPRPVRGFRNARCETSTVGIVPDLPGSNTWNAPSVGATAGFDVAETNDLGELPLPEAPRGVRDNGSADIGSRSGSTFLAGHVNHNSGDLSPWGHLHELEPCAPIFAAGSDGTAHAYRVTDLFVVPQSKLKEDPDLLTTTGPHRLHLVTCSGPEVAGVNRGLFTYQDNLVVRASPVS
ncbi:class F sortase [Rothia uropygialis]|uniref:class F sortase n=1 Tax=Kocuria sp. 36 TaxID=1415402 RepID=UPI0013ECE826|nr:class F sortase [Kocuria sp. 36]